MNFEYLINTVAFAPWAHLYAFLFHTTWVQKLSAPFDFAFVAIEYSIDVSMLMLESPKNIAVGICVVLGLNIISAIKEHKGVLKHGYFSLVNPSSFWYKPAIIMKVLFWVPFAPFWPIYFVIKKSALYVLFTYMTIGYGMVWMFKKILPFDKIIVTNQRKAAWK